MTRDEFLASRVDEIWRGLVAMLNACIEQAGTRQINAANFNVTPQDDGMRAQVHAYIKLRDGGLIERFATYRDRVEEESDDDGE